MRSKLQKLLEGCSGGHHYNFAYSMKEPKGKSEGGPSKQLQSLAIRFLLRVGKYPSPGDGERGASSSPSAS